MDSLVNKKREMSQQKKMLLTNLLKLRWPGGENQRAFPSKEDNVSRKAKSLRSIPLAAMFASLVLLCGAVAQDAKAAMVSLSQSQIDGFQQLGSNVPATTNVIQSPLFGGAFTKVVTTFNPPAPGVGRARVGLQNPSVSFTTADTFKIKVTNTDENSWRFRLRIRDGNGTSLQTAFQTLAMGASTVFALNLASLDVADIRRILLVVKGSLPRDLLGDVTAEYNVAAVPLPPALWLFATALLGLLLIRRRQST